MGEMREIERRLKFRASSNSPAYVYSDMKTLKHQINQEITKVYPDLLKMVGKLTEGKDITQDIIHDAIVDFLNMDEEVLSQVLEDGAVKRFLWTLISTQYKSSTSPLHKKYRDRYELKVSDGVDVHQLDIEDDEDNDHHQLLQLITTINSVCNMFEKQIIADRVIEQLTYIDIAKKHNLSIPLATAVVKGVISKVKLNINK